MRQPYARSAGREPGLALGFEQGSHSCDRAEPNVASTTMHSTHVLPVIAAGAVIAILATGCSASADPSAEAASAATSKASTTQTVLPAGRIAFRRFFDDT